MSSMTALDERTADGLRWKYDGSHYSFGMMSLWHRSCPAMMEISALVAELSSADPDYVAAALEAFQSPRVQAAVEFARSLSRPATKAEIKRNLQILVGSFPNAAKADLSIYGRALALDVMDGGPCIEALTAGTRVVRQHSRFLPTIADVLDWVRPIHRLVMEDQAVLAELPVALSKAKARLAGNPTDTPWTTPRRLT